MAEPYRTNLRQLIETLDLPASAGFNLEVKHFFNGAALYASGSVCLLYNRSGLALKLEAELADRLIRKGEGKPFRFFPNGPVKRHYVALSSPLVDDQHALRKLLIVGINHVVGESDSSL
jgi:TfoX/Sxy family transcriptional regulator of competence genes